MLYRNDYAGKKPSEVQSQQLTNTAGNFNGMYSAPQQYQNTYPTMMQNGFSSVPVSMPAAGAITTSAPTIPAGVPSMPSSMQGMMQASAVQPGNQVPSTVENPFFTPGFLRTQIGRRMRVEFLLGTNLLTDRTGTLVAVGASYIVLKLVDSDDLMMCDIYSIKFVTILL